MHFSNDAACFGIGEFYFGQHKKDESIMALTLGSGIGRSFIESVQAIVDRFDVPNGEEVYYLPFIDSYTDDFFFTRWFVRQTKEMT